MGDETLSQEELDSLLQGAEIISDGTGEYSTGSSGDEDYEEYDTAEEEVYEAAMPEEALATTTDVSGEVNRPVEQVQAVVAPPPVEEVIVGKFTFQQKHNTELLLDIFVQVTVELGRTNIRVKDVLGLGEGSIIELNKPANEPVDLLVNNRLVARGEVVVIDENFGARITNIVAPTERIVLEDHL